MSVKFDHRHLADEMEIFFFDEQVGAGLPIWLPNGVAIRDSLELFIKELENQQYYQRVSSPHVGKKELYLNSGHLKSYAGNMFPPMQWPEEEGQYYLKPMNCPHHHKIFASQIRSYRQMPFRVAEYGQVYRYENSGSLKGLSRVRGLCQNDAHIYVEPVNAADELIKVLDLHEECYRRLGLKGYRYRLSLHDPEKMQNFEGDKSDWVLAESILKQCLEDKNLPYFEAVGEAAFYAPKIDVQMAMGGDGEESIASLQLDINSGKNFGLSYIAKSGEAVVPWIIHRAPLGSHERFVAVLLEYYQGQLPGWLAPVQVSIIPVSEREVHFCEILRNDFVRQGIRAVVDNSSGSLAKRLVFAHKVRPFAKLIIGPKEIESGMFSLDCRKEKIKLGKDDLMDRLKQMLTGY